METIVDCSAVGSRADLHEIFAEALDFPAYYGKNLDALYDCLTSLSGTIRLINWTKNGLGIYAAAVRKVLEAAADRNANLIILFE